MESDSKPKQWAREWIARLWNGRDGRVIEEMMHPDCVFTEMAGGSWESKGHAPYRRNWELFQTAVPDFNGRFLALIGDRSWFGWAVDCRGTISDTTLGADALGKPFNMICLTMAQVVEYKVVFAYNFVSFNQPRVVLPGWLPSVRAEGLRVDGEGGPRSENPVDVLQRYLLAAWGGGENLPLADVVDQEVLIREANAPGFETRGIESVRKNSEWFASQMPEPNIRVLHSVSEGSCAAVVFELSGVVAGRDFGQRAQGQSASVRGMLIGAVQDGRLVRAYSHLDFNHIGAELPAP